ncbi:MAG: WD40/YVTN/BNR-like repeat-containing protein [Acidobacteriaceae bacterium]
MKRRVFFVSEIALLVLACGTLLFAQEKTSGPWVMESSGTAAGLRGIHAVGSGVAWATGTDGTVLRTEDGGSKWQRCAMPPGAEKLDFRGIWAWDANTAIAMSSGLGDRSRIYKTTDGCSHWKLVFTNPEKDGFYDALLFTDPQHGMVLGDPAHGSPQVNPVEGGYFTFRIRVTANGGKTWAPVVDPEFDHPGRNLQPLDGESFFAASNTSMVARDGWLWLGTSKDRVLRRDISGSWIVPAAICAGAVDGFSGSCGIPWMDWQSAHVPLASGSASSGIFSLAFRDAIHGIAVGGDYTKPNEPIGTAAWTTDGGKHWTATSKPPHGFRSAVAWDANAKAWIAAGTNGSDISYDDGKTWAPLDNGNWNALSLPWVVGPHGRIAKLDPKRLPQR